MACLLLVFGLAAPTATAQDTPPIQPEADSPQTAGSTFWIDISVGTDSIPVQDLFGASFVMEYDGSRVDIESDEVGSFLGSDVIYQSNVDSAAGEVDVGITRKSGAGGVDGNGVVARVEVTVPDTVEGDAPLSFDLKEVTANDPDGASIDLGPENLDLTVQPAPPIQPTGAATVTPRDTFWVDVTAGSNSLPVQNLFGTSFTLEYDGARLSVLDDEAGSFLGADVVYQSNVDSAAGTVDIGVTRKSGTGGVDGNGVVARVKVAVADPVEAGTSLPFALTEVTANDPNEESLPLHPQSFTVEIRETAQEDAPPLRPEGPADVRPDSTVQIEIAVGSDSATVDNLFGTSFVLDYDASRVSMMSDEAGTFLGSDVIYQSSVDSVAGTVDVGVTRKSGTGSVSGSGVVAQVQVHVDDTVPEGTELPFDLDEVSANGPEGGVITLAPEQLTIEVSGDTTGDGGSEVVAEPDRYSTSEGETLTVSAPGVLENDSGNALNASAVEFPSNGDLAFDSDGSFEYFPASGFTGTDEFVYEASDGDSTDTATVMIDVTSDSTGTDVVAEADAYSMAKGATLTVPTPGVLGNDSGDSLEASIVEEANGSLTLDADGSFEYTPDTSFVGTDEFVYEAVDGSAVAEATVTINVEEPVASASDSVDASEDAGETVDFGDTGTSVSFSESTEGSGNVSVNRFETPPTDTSGIEGNASEYRVEISLSGDLSVGSNSELRFDVGKLDGVSDPSAVTIYTREVSGNQPFDELETTYDPDANELVATVSGFSEFAFGSETEPLFSYPERVTARAERSFGEASGPGDYRLVALPGSIEKDLSESLSGTVGAQWQAYWDDGSSFVKYDDGSDTFRFEPGNGFWVTSTQPWAAEDTIQSVTLSEDQTTGVSLNGDSTWTIVSNPFDRDVAWSSIQEESGLEQPLWRYDASDGFVTTDTMRSAAKGVAYYVFNGAEVDSLSVPYPAEGSPKTAPRRDEADALLSVQVRSTMKSGPVSTVAVGVGDKRSHVAPPGRFEPVSLRLTPPSRGRSLMLARRPVGDEGRTFPLRLTRRVEGTVELTAENLEAIGNRSVALLHPSAGTTYDLRREEAIEIEPEEKTTKLKLAVGTEDYVEEQADQILPEEVTLTSYPNPARRQGTVEYALPDAKKVTLTLYDVLGREVATLATGRKDAGRHRVQLEADRLASGVYFGRLQAGDQTLTQKITVVR